VSSSQGPVTIMGFAHGPASLTSSTRQTSGVLQLVTPVQVKFALGATSIPLPVLASLQVRFLPEPTWFLGLATGAGLVAAMGWRRRR